MANGNVSLKPEEVSGVFDALLSGKQPGTPEFYEALNLDAHQHGMKRGSEWGMGDYLARTLPNIVPILGPVFTGTVFGKEHQLVARQQQADKLATSMLPIVAPMIRQQQTAPTLQQGQGAMGGFPGGSSAFLEPSQQTPLTPTALNVFGQEEPLGVTEPGMLANARFTPAQMALTEPLRKGEAVLGANNEIVPTALAGVENRKINPEDIQSAIDVAKGKAPTRPLPQSTVNKIIEEQTKGPASMSEENIASQDLFGPGMTVDKLTTKEQFSQLYDRLQETKNPTGIHSNRIATLYGFKNWHDLERNNRPLTQQDVTRLKILEKQTGAPIVAEVGVPILAAADATLYKRGITFAGAGAAARVTGELQQPAGPEAANYFDIGSLQKGRLISAADKEPGITKLDLRQSKTYKFISPNDQQELQQLNNARNTLRELFSRSEYILEPTDQFKASTIQAPLIWTWANGGPGSSDPVKDKSGNVVGTKGEVARAFLDQMKSFGGVVARGVLAERGVLTDADRNVAMQAGVNASDTIKTMKQKQDFFERLMNFQFKAIARLSDNPNASVADLVKEKESLMKEAQKFPAAPAMPAAGTSGLPSTADIDAELARRGKK